MAEANDQTTTDAVIESHDTSWSDFLERLAREPNLVVGETDSRGWAWCECESIRIDLVHLPDLLDDPTIKNAFADDVVALVVDPKNTPISSIQDAIALQMGAKLLKEAGPMPLTSLYDLVSEQVQGIDLNQFRRIFDSSPSVIDSNDDGLYCSTVTVLSNDTYHPVALKNISRPDGEPDEVNPSHSSIAAHSEEGQTAYKISGVLSAIADIFDGANDPVAFKSLQNRLRHRGHSVSDSIVREELALGIRAGLVFDVSAERYWLTKKLRLPDDITKLVQELAVQNLATGGTLSCSDTAWRRDYQSVLVDQVDYALSKATGLLRVSPRKYTLLPQAHHSSKAVAPILNEPALSGLQNAGPGGNSPLLPGNYAGTTSIALLQAVLVLLSEVAQDDHKTLASELAAIDRFFLEGLKVSPDTLKFVRQSLDNEQRSGLSKPVAQVLEKESEAIRALLLKAAFLVVDAAGQHHLAASPTLVLVAQSLNLDNHHISYLGREFDPALSQRARLLAALRLEDPIHPMQLKVRLAELQAELDPGDLSGESQIFVNLVRTHQIHLESIYRTVLTLPPEAGASAPAIATSRFLDVPITKVVKCLKLRKSLELGSVETLRDLLTNPPVNLRHLDGWEGSSWSKLTLYLESYAKQNADCKEAVEAYVKHKQTLRCASKDLVSQASATKPLETLPEASELGIEIALMMGAGPLYFWQILALIQERRRTTTEDEIRAALAVEQTGLFELEGDRFILARCLQLQEAETASLRESAQAYLAGHDRLRCVDVFWRRSNPRVGPDHVDYALSGCPRLTRTSPGYYQLRSKTAALHGGQTAVLDKVSSRTEAKAPASIFLTQLLSTAKAPLPLWKVHEKLRRQYGFDEERVRETLKKAASEGSIFELSNGRFGSPEHLQLPKPVVQALADMAIKHLLQHDELSVFDSNWRPEHRGLNADQVDFALSQSTGLARSRPGLYRREGYTAKRPAGSDSPAQSLAGPLGDLKLSNEVKQALFKTLGTESGSDLLIVDSQKLRTVSLSKSQWQTVALAVLGEFLNTVRRAEAQAFSREIEVILVELPEANSLREKILPKKEPDTSANARPKLTRHLESTLMIIESILARSEPLAQWKICNMAIGLGSGISNCDVEEALLLGHKEGRLFKLLSERYSVADRLSLSPLITQQLETRALKRLNTCHELDCADLTWIGDLRHISSDRVDFSLSTSRQLLRVKPGKYVLSHTEGGQAAASAISPERTVETVTASISNQAPLVEWEASLPVRMPTSCDNSIQLSASLHQKISNHVPLDPAASWADIEIDLP